MDKFDFLLLKFLEHLKVLNFSERSIPNYRQDVKRFLEFLRELGIQEISAVDRKALQDYQSRIYLSTSRGKPLAPATQYKQLSSIRTFFRYLLKAGIVLYDPSSNLELPRLPKLLPQNILSKKEIGALLAVPNLETIKGIRDRAIMEVLYATGIRSSELCNLTLNDLNLHDGEIRINQGKGNKDRLVPLGEVAANFLEIYLREARPKLADPAQTILFVNKKGRKFSRSHIYDLISTYAKKAKLHTTGPHAIRHTCATHLLRGKADLRQIQKILGHVSVGTTQRYTKVEIGDLKQVLKRCHPREKGEIHIEEL